MLIYQQLAAKERHRGVFFCQNKFIRLNPDRYVLAQGRIYLIQEKRHLKREMGLTKAHIHRDDSPPAETFGISRRTPACDM